MENCFKVGEEVYWNDPDDGVLSGVYTVKSIDVDGEVFVLTDDDGGIVEAYASELSSPDEERTYAVDVHWDVVKCFRVKAKSREEAEAVLNKRIAEGGVCVWTDGFEATDDVDVICAGEEDTNGNMNYY